MAVDPSLYLNACSHGLPDPACAEAVARQALRPPGQADEEAELRERARRACAALLDAGPAAVGLGTGTFSLWSTIMERLPARRGRILVAPHEWGDHVRWLQRLSARTGLVLDVVAGERGALPGPAAWAARMDDDVLALCLPLVTSVDGLRYPAREIAALDRPTDALVVLDAAQALGRVPVAPGDLGCDVLVGTARKWLRGPRQTATVWLSSRAERVLGCDARSVEPFDLNAALLAGMRTAVSIALDRGIVAISQDIAQLDGLLRAELADADTVEVRPPVKACLHDRSIVAKWCDAGRDEPLSGAEPGVARLRFSPHAYNDVDNIASVANALKIGLSS
ncbi:MAG: aminotransferase class V-fold PLP-dependent enzyme [Pseudomonadota bacterium]